MTRARCKHDIMQGGQVGSTHSVLVRLQMRQLCLVRDALLLLLLPELFNVLERFGVAGGREDGVKLVLQILCSAYFKSS